MLNRWLAIFGVAAFLCFGLTWWDSSIQPPHGQPGQSEDNAASQHPSDDSSKKPATPFFQWLGSRTDGQITAYATIIIAIFTIVLGIGTGFLVVDGRRHSRRQLRAYLSLKQGNVMPGVDDRSIIIEVVS